MRYFMNEQDKLVIKNIMAHYKHTPAFIRNMMHNNTMATMDAAVYREPAGYKKDFDTITGSVGGALAGGTAGALISKKFDKDSDSLARTLAKRALGGLLGATAGGALGAGLGPKLGNTDLINKLYQKLGVATKRDSLVKRDMAGRLYRYRNSENGSLADKDANLLNIMSATLDYGDIRAKQMRKLTNFN